MTRYEIEQQTNEIISKLADNYKVDTDFYGDHIPFDVQELENKIEFCKDEDDIEYYFEQIKDILEQYAIETSYEVNCVDCINDEVKGAFLKKDKTELFEAIKKAVPTGVRFQVEEMNRNYDTWEVDTFTSLEEAYDTFSYYSRTDYTYLNYISDVDEVLMIIKRCNNQELCFKEKGIDL